MYWALSGGDGGGGGGGRGPRPAPRTNPSLSKRVKRRGRRPGCRSSRITPHSPHPPPRAATAVPPSVRPLVRSSARSPVRPLVRSSARPPRPAAKHSKGPSRRWPALVPQQRDHAAQSASPLRAATAVHPSVRQLVRPSARPPARPLASCSRLSRLGSLPPILSFGLNRRGISSRLAESLRNLEAVGLDCAFVLAQVTSNRASSRARRLRGTCRCRSRRFGVVPWLARRFACASTCRRSLGPYG